MESKVKKILITFLLFLIALNLFHHGKKYLTYKTETKSESESEKTTTNLKIKNIPEVQYSNESKEFNGGVPTEDNSDEQLDVNIEYYRHYYRAKNDKELNETIKNIENEIGSKNYIDRANQKTHRKIYLTLNSHLQILFLLKLLRLLHQLIQSHYRILK